MSTIHKDIPTGIVEGEIRDDRFAPLLDVFLENFASRGEQGASLCVTHEGRVVVDLWGGSANPREETPWEQDTLAVVFSSTKGALALCAHMLVDEGKLDPNAPVVELWPEYGANGKDATTLQMMLDHTAGVPAFREPVPDGGLADWNWATSALAAQEPFFEPGTRSAYHGLTFAWTVGEMIRRAAGQTAGALFAERVAKPLGLDFWIGAPEEVTPRMARILKARFRAGAPISPFMHKLLNEPGSIPALFFNNGGGFSANNPLYWQAEIGSAAGVGNARSLARMYAGLACGGSLDGVKLVSPDALIRMQTVTNASHDDATLHEPLRVAGGYMVTRERRLKLGHGYHHMGRAAFGHVGAGGSIGLADPEAGLSFSYVMNQQGAGASLNERGQFLIDAAYEAIGWRATALDWRP